MGVETEGLGSTHSTNAISMTFVLWKLIGEGSFELGAKVLLIFTCLSVVFGRIYTGMVCCSLAIETLS